MAIVFICGIDRSLKRKSNYRDIIHNCLYIACIRDDPFVRNYTDHSNSIVSAFTLGKLGSCPFHGRVERDEIPTRESPPKQSGTLPCPALPFPPLHSTPVPSTPLHSLPSACLLLCLSMHTVCDVGELN